MEKIKGLEELEKVRNRLIAMCDFVQSKDPNAFIECNNDIKKYVDVNYIFNIEKELKAIDSVRTKGVVLVVPESEYLNNEHISIQIYKKHFTNEQWQELLEVLNG